MFVVVFIVDNLETKLRDVLNINLQKERKNKKLLKKVVAEKSEEPRELFYFTPREVFGAVNQQEREIGRLLV